MKSTLTKTSPVIFHYINGKRTAGAPGNTSGDLSGIKGDLSGIKGDLSNVRGDLTNITGDMSGVKGDLTSIVGDVTDITGDVDTCEISAEDRTSVIRIDDLVSKLVELEKEDEVAL